MVNTTDGVVWKLRPVTRDGQPLYALADAPVSCPEFVMATYAELVEHGVSGSADVLPMPVGPEGLSPEREAEIREWVEAMGKQKDIRYYGSWQQHGELLGEIDRLRARAAELEAQREVLAERLLAGQQWERGRSPELVSENFVSQSELRSIFGIPLVAPWADGLTRLLAPTQALREDEAAEAALIVYRAGFRGHDIPLGFYDNQAAARAHCEAFMRRETPAALLDWIEDEEDGVAELVATVGGEETETGYVVAALEIASAFDETADE